MSEIETAASMDVERFWAIVEKARVASGDRADDRDSPDDPLPAAVLDAIAELEPAEIIAFAQTYREVFNSAYSYKLWAAAYLIEGGCSDDGFMDFRAGLILQGRDRFARALADPDSLAELPVVKQIAQDDSGWIGCEEMNYTAEKAYLQKVGNSDSFDAALSQPIPNTQPEGELWDFDDEQEAQSRLPSLAALFL